MAAVPDLVDDAGAMVVRGDLVVVEDGEQLELRPLLDRGGAADAVEEEVGEWRQPDPADAPQLLAHLVGWHDEGAGELLVLDLREQALGALGKGVLRLVKDLLELRGHAPVVDLTDCAAQLAAEERRP